MIPVGSESFLDSTFLGQENNYNSEIEQHCCVLHITQ